MNLQMQLSVRQLESRIAKHLEASLGYGVDTFVRTAEEVAGFPDQQKAL
jgi:hypothetical protein